VRWAARIYPAQWRARYGAEFEALLEDMPAGRRVFWNILAEALKMRILSWDLRKTGALVAGCLLAGAVAGAIASFAMPVRYESQAYTRVNTGGAFLAETASALQKAKNQALSRGQMVKIIAEHRLYPEVVKEQALEDAVGEMQRHVRVSADVPPSGGIAIRVGFDYPDPAKAQAVTERLSESFNAALVDEGQRSGVPLTVEPEPRNDMKPFRVFPNRTAITVVGSVAGLLLGLLAAAVRRRRRRTVAVKEPGAA
jgi:capsular polysaccharide biosynthesis protein